MKNADEVVITAGSAYTDIDVFACAAAYKRLCELKGVHAKIVLPGPLNASVSKSVQALHVLYSQSYEDNEHANYVLVDVSDPHHVPSFFHEDRALAVFDHHWGYEAYWQSRIGDGAKIEFVGSCATLLWEAFVKEDLQNQIGDTVSLLLYTAILSNTLNLNAQITSERDRKALQHLAKSKPDGWEEQYFNEVSAEILLNPDKAMKHDTKNVTIHDRQYSIIQIELWNSQQFVKEQYETILTRLQSAPTPYAFFTSPSLSEGINYLVCHNDEMRSVLKTCIDADFEGNNGTTTKLWLRKEIIKAIGVAIQ